MIIFVFVFVFALLFLPIGIIWLLGIPYRRTRRLMRENRLRESQEDGIFRSHDFCDRKSYKSLKSQRERVEGFRYLPYTSQLLGKSHEPSRTAFDIYFGYKR